MLPPVALVSALHCDGSQGTAFANPLQDQAPLHQNKAAAILGGQQSALALISAQQADAVIEVSSHLTVPAAAAWGSASTLCGLPWSSLPPATDIFDVPKAPSDQFLGSARISIGRTPFDNAWARVSRKSSLGSLQYEFPRLRDVGLNELRRVNFWVNSNIEYAEDIDLYGRRDYWATAAETLRHMKGDCEDYAILKYQILMHMGIHPSDMFLTLTRDRIRKRDHAVLIVKLDNRFYLLDNNTPELLEANDTYEYTARLSYNQNGSWLHGFTHPTQASPYARRANLAYFSDSAVSNARLTGFKR